MLQQHAQAGVDERTVELIAARVTAALREDIEALAASFTRRERSTGSLTVEQLAARLGVARSTVYAHWREWGGYKLGSSPKAPIRFSADALPSARDDAAASPANEVRLSHKTARRNAPAES
jgi:transposase-like protein